VLSRKGYSRKAGPALAPAFTRAMPALQNWAQFYRVIGACPPEKNPIAYVFTKGPAFRTLPLMDSPRHAFVRKAIDR
jgi:hypothetical protein